MIESRKVPLAARREEKRATKSCLSQPLSVRRRAFDILCKCGMGLCVTVTVALTVFLILYVLLKGLPEISWKLLSTSRSYLTDSIGILPDILSTLYIVVTTILIVVPLGVGAAVYLTEYASNKKLVAVIE